ncbi:Ig-like domain-containing protein [Kitasatospora sp. NPDC004240]
MPVAVGGSPATLAGWIDFDHNGRFDATERVQSEVPAGTDHAVLEWTVPADAASGETWARLRIGRDAAQLVSSGGFADSGQVADQRIGLTVGAARPEIVGPVDGTVLADARPRVRGEGGVVGATVEVRDGDSTLCRARVEYGGGWSCRPDTALTGGAHSLTLVETTGGGVVLRGEPVRVTVKTAPPTAPVFTLPEFTNDPGLQLTGTGEPGSTVSVADQTAELCGTAVRADGGWSCLPVEHLPDGRHRLTPVAVDAAGNRTPGKPATLVVDTVAPARPVLTSPAAGETVRAARPTLGGRAEGGAKVIVTARTGDLPSAAAASAERTVLCGATAALDGGWTCNASRDLAGGDQWLTVTATDPAGNSTAGEAVVVHVALPAPAPARTPAGTPSTTAPASPSAAALASASASPPPAAAASGSATPVRPSPSPSPSPAAPVVVPDPVGGPLPPVAPGLLPIAVPPVAPVPASPSASPVPTVAPAAASGSATPTRSPSPSPSVAPAPVAAASRMLAVPPAGAEVVAEWSGPDTRRTGLLGVLLLLIAFGLVVRRVRARGSGSRRR